MISRNYQQAAYQYIDLQSSIEYIDNLKSRIYKVFFTKSQSKISRLQLICINSPLVVFTALKKQAEATSLYLNSFELGYLVACLSSNSCIDTSFYYYYRENFVLNIVYLLQALIEKTKYIVLNWCIEPYQDYLLRGKKISLYQINNIDDFNRFIGRKFDNKNILCLGLSYCFSYFYLSAFINRLSFDKSIKSYIFTFLNSGMFSYFMSCFDASLVYMMFKKSKKSFFFKLLNIFMFYISSEIYAMFMAFLLPSSRKTITMVRYSSAILIFSQDSLVLKVLLKKLQNFLLFNGVEIKKDASIYLSSLAAFCVNTLFIIASSEACPLCFVARPSLYSQFHLMKQISLVLRQSVSQPLFLLIIRINKLLFIWSSSCAGNSIGKIFYLIDYLIYLKLRLFVKKSELSYLNLQIAPCLKLQNNKTASIILIQASKLIFLCISSHRFYKFYVFTKMFWIYKMKCLPN